MLRNVKSDRRGLMVGGARAAALTAAAGAMGLPAAALAQEGEFGPPRKFIWVPQALGDWDMALQVGAKDFCEMVGWEYQRIGNPVYSVQNHAEQVNNAIAAQADAIATSLESVGLVQPFERGLDQGIAMIITDQGIQEEADALGLHIINQDEFNAGIINGTQAATFAHELTGKTEGVIVLGNGNPGSTSIDKRQNGSQLGIEQYNAANGTSYQFEAFPDSSFGELTESIQKWTAQIDQKGDQLVAAIGTGNPNPIVQALQGARHRARHHRGRLDRHPAGAPAADRRGLGAVGHRPAVLRHGLHVRGRRLGPARARLPLSRHPHRRRGRAGQGPRAGRGPDRDLARQGARVRLRIRRADGAQTGSGACPASRSARNAHGH